MGKGIERTQILRIDCTTCNGQGYVTKQGLQESCEACGGVGMLEREVPFKFETQGAWDHDDVAREFGLDPSQAKDSGHDVPKDERDRQHNNGDED